ncbi:hypothetical protein HMI54_002249 [Coelomomyces lativittatus]|nr:hypothetical protein HMI54_002249 [Coelomomyces lativittatus]
MHWDSANYSSTSKEELKERRNEAAQSNFIKKEEEKKRKSKEKWEKQQYLVKQQMQVEQIERKKVESAKETERSLAEASLHEWTNSLATAASPDIRNNKLPSEESSDEEDEEIRRLKEKYQAILNRRKNVNSTSSDRPPPRASGSAIMTFTSRMFPTAARESQDAKWMAQLEEAKKASHEDIQKLESKSNQFMKAEQWYLAIETLTEAIKLAPSNHRCYVARSECYFRVGQYNSALDDIQQSIFHIEAMERQHELVNVYDNVKQALSKRKEICEQRLVAGN